MRNTLVGIQTSQCIDQCTKRVVQKHRLDDWSLVEMDNPTQILTYLFSFTSYSVLFLRRCRSLNWSLFTASKLTLYPSQNKSQIFQTFRPRGFSVYRTDKISCDVSSRGMEILVRHLLPRSCPTKHKNTYDRSSHCPGFCVLSTNSSRHLYSLLHKLSFTSWNNFLLPSCRIDPCLLSIWHLFIRA